MKFCRVFAGAFKNSFYDFFADGELIGEHVKGLSRWEPSKLTSDGRPSYVVLENGEVNLRRDGEFEKRMEFWRKLYQKVQF